MTTCICPRCHAAYEVEFTQSQVEAGIDAAELYDSLCPECEAGFAEVYDEVIVVSVN